jgi:hypothetical protein
VVADALCGQETAVGDVRCEHGVGDDVGHFGRGSLALEECEGAVGLALGGHAGLDLISLRCHKIRLTAEASAANSPFERHDDGCAI